MARLIDREKVIKGLEICSEHGSWHGLNCEDNEAYKDCPYRGCETGCVTTIAKDAITLLKGQEPVIPIKNDFEIPLTSYYSFECECTAPLMKDQPYCMKCGRPVKWN